MGIILKHPSDTQLNKQKTPLGQKQKLIYTSKTDQWIGITF